MGGQSWRALMQSGQQLLVVELHAVGGLVLDAVPQRLELRAVQARPAGS